MDTVVELEGVNGEWFTLAGPDAGDRGVSLGTGVTGLYDPPVKTVYEEPGNYPGSRYLSHRILRRDVVFGVEILNDKNTDSWLSRDSEWRKAWAFDADCTLYVTTEESGTRYLKLRLQEQMDISLFTDPRGLTCNRVGMVCVAGDPFWYQDDVVYTEETQTDTRFDPSAFAYPWPYDQLPHETLHIVVDPADGKGGLNPTDQEIFLKWVVPGSEEAPAQPYIPGLPWLGAPASRAVIWTLPDYSFEDSEMANRRLRLPGLIGGLRTEEVQYVYIDGRPTAGTFKLGFQSELTAPIAYNASAATVATALKGMTAIGLNDVAVSQQPATNEKQTIKLLGGPTSGTFTLTFGSETTAGIPFNASASQVKAALQALPSVGYLDIRVTETASNEVQRIEVVGEPTGGTFTLTLDGHTTAPIAYNATAITVVGALQALPNVGNLNVTVIGENLFLWGPYQVTFGGFNLGGVNLNQMTSDPSGLTGGTDMDVHVTTVTQGAALYEVTFQSALAGLNLAQMTANPAGLGGGVSPSVVVETTVDGSRPYVVTFKGQYSGVDVPALTIDTTGLSGDAPTGRVAVGTEGVTAPAENCLVDTDPRVEQISSESGSQIWARMNGVRFRHPIPPWTKSHDFEIEVSGCAPGQMVTLRLPRPWSRPWGLE